MNTTNHPLLYASLLLLLASCGQAGRQETITTTTKYTNITTGDTASIHSNSNFTAGAIDSAQLSKLTDTTPAPQPVYSSPHLPDSIVAFAKTLIGTPYKFGCTAPETGFDCSGFITYVFSHFHVKVPRSSVDFTNEGTPVAAGKERPGDIILFTGTNPQIRTVGHIGIIVSNVNGLLTFIHASSSKEMAVIITEMNDRYRARFVKIIRLVN
jgi:cell wall-associated NlpC family hydrolase